MNAKLSTSLLVLLLSWVSQLTARAQANDCYDIHCPTNIVAPCEGIWGAHAWYSVTVSNRCASAPAPIITYSTPPGSVFPPGTNKVCATIQIPGLPARECCFDVIVDRCCSTNCIDVICPRDIVVGCSPSPGPPGAMVDLPQPKAVNYCGDGNIPATFSFRCIPASPNPGQPVFFPPGTNKVVCCLSDSASDYINCCSFNVVVTNCPPVTDQCRPQIICPTDYQVQCQGNGGGIVFFPAPKIIDPCNLVTAISFTHNPGTFFPNGKTTVVTCITWHDPATGVEMTDCCSFDVIVRCCQPTNCITRLDCPQLLEVECAGPNGTPLIYNVTGTNTCETTTVVCNPPSGSIIFGNTNVCCKLLNSAGISLADCCFPVRLRDTIPPVITCPSNIVAFSQTCGPIDVPYPLPTASDNCALDRIECVPPPGSPFFPGITSVTCCAYDKAGNSNCCSFAVVVRCPTDCVRVVCPPDITVDCAGPNGAPVYFNAYGTNICTGGMVPVICSWPSGSVFPPGVTQVCCTNVPTPTGATALQWCCFNVTVRPDTVPPTIVCPTNIVVDSPNCTKMDVLYPIPVATDNCGIDHIQCIPPPGSFPVGTTTVTCCAVDKASNSACCTFTVTVRCPSNDCLRIVCPQDILVGCAGPNGAQVNYDAYVTNTCTGARLPVICSWPSGSIFPPGVTQVCCTNAPTPTPGPLLWCCFTVTVRPDTEPPTIICPPNIVVDSPNCTKMEVLYPIPAATDNCQIDHIECTPPPGIFPVGATSVTCCAFDKAGNSNCCTFTVTVRCPSNDCVHIVCPHDIFVDCASPNGAVVNFDAYGTNTCTGARLPVVCSQPSGSVFPPGITHVCCTNTPSTSAALQWCCFDVIVRPDTIPPVINCPSNIFIFCAKPNGTRVEYKPTATDNCDAAPTITCIPPSGSLFLPGCTNVTCVARDAAGNASTCTFKVCVLREGCYLYNPSFEILNANVAAPVNCGDPIGFATGWSALSGTPDLFRPPFASLIPGNCRGRENPCQGTNYAGLEGGYTATGGFFTEEMMGTLIAPLNNGQLFRLRACLSLAESSSGPVLLEFVLANSADLTQQVKVHEVWVTQREGWMQYQPPCFRVPREGHWDRLIIRMGQVVAGVVQYKTGYAYIDNVNICCCKPLLLPPVVNPNGVLVQWSGRGQLQGTKSLDSPIDWHDIDTSVQYDPDRDLFSTEVPFSDGNVFFRVVGPDGGTIDCAECGT